MIIFCYEIHNSCYGPECMAYARIKGIKTFVDEDGRPVGVVVFQEEEEVRDLYDELEGDGLDAATLQPHAHVEMGNHNPWAGVASVSPTEVGKDLPNDEWHQPINNGKDLRWRKWKHSLAD